MSSDHKNTVLRKTVAIGIVCLFIINDLARAYPSEPKDAALAPPLRTADPKFRDKYVLGEFSLSLEGVKHFISAQVEKEKGVFQNAWMRHRVEAVNNIYDPSSTGRITGRVDGLRSVIFVRVSALLSSTGKAAFVDLIGGVEASREFGGIPVVYIDSTLSDTPDKCIQRHEIDEIIQWEDFRQNVLGIGSNRQMAGWIRRHLDSADEKLNHTDYKGLSAIQIAELFHGHSYPIRDLYAYLKNTDDKGSAELDHGYISAMLQNYPVAVTEGISITAEDDEAGGGAAPLSGSDGMPGKAPSGPNGPRLGESSLTSGPFSEFSPGFTPIPQDGGPILAFGSSSTEGVVDRELLSYPALLQRMIGHPVINSGVGGERIEGEPVYVPSLGVSRLAGELDRYRPSLLILWHGRNDLLDGKSEEPVGRALVSMIDEAKRRNIQVLLLGVPKSGALKDADIYSRVAQEEKVPYLREIYEDVFTNRERMADDIHANAEGNFIFAERISEFLRTQGALDTRDGFSVLNLRTIRLIELIELLDRNLFLIQGPWSPDGRSSYHYNDKQALGFEGEHYQRPNFSRIMDMGDRQLDEISRILADIIRDRVRLGKLKDMRAYHHGDEERLRSLTEKLDMKIPGFTAVSLLTGKKSAAPDLTDKHILIVPAPPTVRPGTYEAIRSFYADHMETVKPVYDEAVEEFRGVFSMEQLMLEPSSVGLIEQEADHLPKETILRMLAHFLYVIAQYEVLKREAAYPVKLDYATGDSMGLETAMVISGVMTRRDFIRFIRGRYEMMPRIMESTYGRLIVPFVSPGQIQALVQPQKIEVVSFGNDNLATIVVRTSGKKETQDIAETIAGKMRIPVEEIRVTFPVSRYVHHSFYGDWFRDGLKRLSDRISFQDPRIPIIDSSIDSFAYLRILNTAEEARQVFLTSILSTAYWHQTLRLIQYSTNNQVWINSTPESPQELRRYLGARDRSAPTSRLPATEDAALISQNTPDIENLRKLLNVSLPEQENSGELKYYTVRYDLDKIPQGSPAEEILKIYVERILPLWLVGRDRVELRPSRGSGQSLISVECYSNRSRSQLVGEGHVDVDEDISGKALRITGMLNMALTASHIPKDMAAEEADKYDGLISFIKAQYKDICGEELAADLLQDMSKGIFIRLPHAAQVPVDKVEEYYRLTITQLSQSA